jgi:guanine deaminase
MLAPLFSATADTACPHKTSDLPMQQSGDRQPSDETLAGQMELAGKMEIAIRVAEQGIAIGQAPFGAAIFDAEGELVAAEHNRVRQDFDPSAHAEVVAIRSACQKTGQRKLAGFWLYSTCEPCPMCASTLVFAGIRHVCFGASVQDALAAGFEDLQIPCHLIFDKSRDAFITQGGVLRERCRQLFER